MIGRDTGGRKDDKCEKRLQENKEDGGRDSRGDWHSVLLIISLLRLDPLCSEPN